MFDFLKNSWPPLTIMDDEMLSRAIDAAACEAVVSAVRTAPPLNDCPTTASSATFLLSLAKVRDYARDCAICLTDKIVGTTCKRVTLGRRIGHDITCRRCGHTEIAVFRPCGHAMCANPCFRSVLAAAGARVCSSANVNAVPRAGRASS